MNYVSSVRVEGCRESSIALPQSWLVPDKIKRSPGLCLTCRGFLVEFHPGLVYLFECCHKTAKFASRNERASENSIDENKLLLVKMIVDSTIKNKTLSDLADLIAKHRSEIIRQNKIDLDSAGNIDPTLIDRLKVDEKK